MTCVAICVSAGHGRPLRHGLGTRAPHHRLRLESLQEGQRLLSHHQVGYFGNLILFCAEHLLCHWIGLLLNKWRYFRILETVKIKCGAKESEIWPYIVQVDTTPWCILWSSFPRSPNRVPIDLVPCFRHLLAFHQELRPTLDELGVLLPEVKLLCLTPQPHFTCDT